MTDIEKKVKIKALQEEINRRCSFFLILSDIKGSNTGKKLVNDLSLIKKP